MSFRLTNFIRINTRVFGSGLIPTPPEPEPTIRVTMDDKARVTMSGAYRSVKSQG